MFGKDRSAHGAVRQVVVVPGSGVRVDRRLSDAPSVEARARFGGVDMMAILAGTLAALGSTALLSAALASVGRIGYTTGTVDGETLGTSGLVAGLVVLLVSLLFGGWVAGRMARYDGGRNGLLVGLLFVALTAGLGALVGAMGSDAGQAVGPLLPTWLGAGSDRAALISLGVALAVVLLTSFLGGRAGSRWHRKVDEVLTHTTSGGIAGTQVTS